MQGTRIPRFGHQAGFLLALLLALNSLVPRAFAAEDPHREWTLEKRGHVVLIYSSDTKGFVDPTWRSLDRAFSKIEELFGWSLDRELTVVISDHVDQSNGWARVLPYPDIHLLAFPPPLDSALAGPGDWWDRLILHELVHILHLLRSGGVHDWINRVLGPIDYPNNRLPTWFKEGLAVWVESHNEKQGRLNHPRFLGRKRVTLLEQDALTIDRLTTGPIAPPGGTAAYMFGGAFIAHMIDEEGGALGLRNFIEKYGSQLIPFGMNLTMSRLGKQSFMDAYDVYMEYEQSLARDEAKERGREPHVGRKLVEEQFSAGSLLLRPGETEFVSLENDGNHETHICVRSITDGRLLRKIRCHGSCSGGISLAGHGLFALVSTLSPVGPVRSSGDLYSYALKGAAEPERWTFDAHLARPDARRYPEKSVLAVQVDTGNSSVVELAGPGADIETVVASRDGIRVDMPRRSHRSNAIVFVESDDQESRLMWISEPGKEALVLARSTWPFAHPTFADDDKSLFVSTVVSGVYEVVQIQLDTGSVQQWTRSVGGTAYPMPLKNGALVFADMRGAGWSIQKIEKPTYSAFVQLEKIGPVLEKNEVQHYEYSGKHPSLLGLARPRNVMPLMRFVTGQSFELGIELSGRDPLPHHQWYFTLNTALSASGMHRLPDYGGFYRYGGLPLDLVWDGYDFFSERYGFDGSKFHAAEGRARGGQFSLWLSQRNIESTDIWGLGLGLRQEISESPFKRPDPGGSIPTWIRDEIRPDLSLHFRHHGRRNVRYGTLPHHGFSLGTSIHLEPSIDPLRDDRWSLNWFFTAPITLSSSNRVVLTNRFHGRLSFAPESSRKIYRLGGFDTQNMFENFFEGNTVDYEDMRGFAVNAFKGFHVQRWTLDLSLKSWDILRGIRTWPVAMRRLVPAFFADLGWIGPYRMNLEDVHASAGFELRLEIELGYGIPSIIRTGLAQGIGVEGITQGYIVWGAAP